MKLFITQGTQGAKSVVLDDMILTKNMPTSAGSKMLDGFVSLFEAEVVTRLENAGYTIGGKINTGEFGVDLLGETSFFSACADDNGKLNGAAGELIKNKEALAAVQLDVNGAPQRVAALNDLIYIKPTYATISRFGTIPAVCSGETIGITADSVETCRELLDVLAGHDDKDGTSLPEEMCAKVKKDAPRNQIKKVAVAKSLVAAADEETAQKIAQFKAFLETKGVECVEVDAAVLMSAKAAWNVLMSAELCNNVSRYDGVKFGHRSKTYTNIDELYTNSRSEAFGELVKSLILLGSDVLSTDNYMSMYDKAQRVRRVIVEAFAAIFADFDCVLAPVCSKRGYTLDEVQANKYIACEENLFTAPASISGLPVVVAGGVQLIGPAFSENSLLDLAESYEKEQK